MEVYKDLDKLPTGRATDEITEGCMVLEGRRLESAVYVRCAGCAYVERH